MDEAKSKEFSHPLFNIENINAFLNDSQQISDRAEKFKSLFELFANNSSYPKKLKNQPLNLKSLQKNFQSLSFEKINQFIAPKISSESVEYFKTAPSDKGKDSECFCTCKEVDLNTLEFNKVEHIKWYINEKVNEMKEDILRQIDIKLNEFREENNLNAEKIKRLLDG